MRVGSYLGRLRISSSARLRVARHHSVADSSRPARGTEVPGWFLLPWLMLVYLRELLYLYGIDVPKKWYAITQCLPGAGEPRACPPNPIIELLDASPARLGAFTLLFLCQSALIWAGLWGRLPRRLLWPCFFTQGAVLLAIAIVAQQFYVVFGLYLAMTLGPIVTLRRTRDTVLVVGGFGVSLIVAGKQAWPRATSGALWNVADGLMLLVFAAAYVAMYARKTQATRQVEDYAARVEALTLLAERRRLARELHDTLAQGVVGLTLQLETIDSLLDDAQDSRAQELVRHALRRARTTLATARGAIDDLRTRPIDAIAAIRQTIDTFTATTGVDCHAALTGLCLLSIPQQEQVAGVIAEALCNVERHARAARVSIQAVAEHGWLQVEVSDDGVGFDPAAVVANDGHYGLRGMHERARLLDGKLAILGGPGQGTLLRLSIPAPDALPSGATDMHGEITGAHG
jgi:two-component system, NarL family, sensor histidine kinase YdfH